MSDTPATHIEHLGDGRYLVTAGRTRRVAFGVRADGETWVFMDGRTWVLPDPERTAPARSARRDEHAALSAPMPATVVLLHVSPGATVSKGDVLVVLEAMKMELPIRAPRDGRVKAVHCRQGELAQPGVPLVELV